MSSSLSIACADIQLGEFRVHAGLEVLQQRLWGKRAGLLPLDPRLPEIPAPTAAVQSWIHSVQSAAASRGLVMLSKLVYIHPSSFMWCPFSYQNKDQDCQETVYS